VTAAVKKSFDLYFEHKDRRTFCQISGKKKKKKIGLADLEVGRGGLEWMKEG